MQSPPSAAAAGHMRAQASSTNMALKCDWTSLSPDVLAKVFKACELGRDRKKFSHAERMRTGPYWCYTPSPRSNFRIICKAWCEAAGWLLLHCTVIAAVTLHHHLMLLSQDFEHAVWLQSETHTPGLAAGVSAVVHFCITLGLRLPRFAFVVLDFPLA